MRAALLTTGFVLIALVAFSWDRLALFDDDAPKRPERTARQGGLPSVGAARVESRSADVDALYTTASVPGDAMLAAIRTHVVGREDTLWSIALDYYGDDAYARAILEINRNVIDDARVLREGQVLILP